MLKLSLAVTLFTSITGSVLTSLPPTEKREKFSATLLTIDTINQKITPTQHDQITQLIQFIRNKRNITNGIQNNRTTPTTFTLTTPTPTPNSNIEANANP